MLHRIVVLAFAFGLFPMSAFAEKPHVTAGEHRIVLKPAKYGKYDLSHFPDQPITVLSARPLSMLMVCGNGTMHLSGRSWDSITYAEPVLAPSGGTAFDNGYAGIGGVYRSGRTLYALYHAEDHVDKSSAVAEARNQFAGMFSVGMAMSVDNGKSFRKQGQVLSSPHPYKPGMECGGLGDITLCPDRTGTYMLAYYADFSRGQGKGIQICAARCAVRDRAMPGKWEKYYNGEWNEPGLGGKESYVMEIAGADAWCPHVTYAKTADRYILTFARTENGETDGVSYYHPKKSGIYIAVSKDGVTWSEPVAAFNHSVLLIKGQPGALHPTLVVGSQTKQTIAGTLCYAYTPNWPDVPHHLAARSIEINIGDE